MVVTGRGSRRRFVLVLMVLTAITLATLDSRSGDSGPIGAAGRVAHRVVQPVSNAANTVFSPVHDWWRGVTNHDDIVAENRKITNQLQTAQAAARAGEDARRDLKRFQDLFRYPYQEQYATVGARVTASNSGNFENQVVINRGTESGIRPNMAVIGPEGLVGRIAVSWQGGSTVVLVSDRDFGVAVRTKEWKQSALAKMGDDGRMSMTFVDDPKFETSTVRVAEGDTMFTCGCESSRFPMGIPVGVIDRAIRTGDKSQVRVRLKSFLDRRSLELVKVITTSPNDPVPPQVQASVTPSKPTTTTTAAGPTTTTTAGP